MDELVGCRVWRRSLGVPETEIPILAHGDEVAAGSLGEPVSGGGAIGRLVEESGAAVGGDVVGAAVVDVSERVGMGMAAFDIAAIDPPRIFLNYHGDG